jgi:hypothetical protein
MRALLVLVSGLVVILCLVPLGLGVSLLVTPIRTGTFLNEAFAIFPRVQDEDGWTQWFYRALGVGCMALSGYFFRQVWENLVSPAIGFLL